MLDALAEAIASRRVAWDEKLTITDQVKSLPSGVLQNKPEGTRVSVRDVADALISISDNTARTCSLRGSAGPRSKKP